MRRDITTVTVVITTFIIVVGVSSCDRSEESAPGATAESVATSDKSPQNQGASGGAQDDRYSVVSPDRAVAVGQTDQVEFAITPGAGLKINKKFPWKLTFQETEGVEIASKTVSRSSFDLSEDKAAVPVAMRVAEAGEHRVTATGDFSVCTPNKCYSMRDQKVEFSLEAADKEDEKGHAEKGGPTDKDPSQIEGAPKQSEQKQ